MTSALQARQPRFLLGDGTGIDEAREAIAAAVATGRTICRIAPMEWWVDISTRKQDEWADYTTVRGNIVWSLARINDILAKANVRDSFGRVWELRSIDSLDWLMGAELGEQIIRKAAISEEISLNGYWRDHGDASSESSVTITWKHITRESRFGIGN